MARYKKTGFMDDDAGSVSSIQLNEGVRSGGTHIRYHMGNDGDF
ncbi:unnamed protein product [Spodoptera littoralis]|uniref:Uncharacterized protein n=1 Tax=Spodoptera littoralis TaxID=7109 RepID=A0A9P0IDI5_SPOLI|nr:unnamed protein product [Spodoptera littoralis]CAH1643891.1 unnamed protein product [Spodoptera littoralis]